MVRQAAGLFLLVGLIALAPAAPPDKEAPTGGVYKKAIKSVAWVVTPFEEAGGRFRYGTGTGSLIDKTDKLVITNYHVVRDYKTVSVLFPIFDKNSLVTDRDRYLSQVKGGGAAKGEVIAKDPSKDLALLKLDKLPSDAPFIRLAKDGIGPGDVIHCIGNPGVSGGLWAYTPGHVKNVFLKEFATRSRSAGEKGSFDVKARVIENTAMTNEGDSGGPVLNGGGELVGVTQGYLGGDAARGVSYAIDISEVKAFLKANKYSRLLNVPAAVTTASDAPPVEQPKPAAPDPKAEAARANAAAANKLAFAKEFIKDGKTAKAKERLEDIIKTYPDSPAAAEAKQLLATLK